MKRTFEAVVVGMGPAGMTAATALAECGVPVAVVDEGHGPGGQVYRPLPQEFTLREDRFSGVRRRRGESLIRRFERMRERMTLFAESTVFAFFKEDELSLIRGGELLDVGFRRLILCEGAMERIVPFPGWTLPGVMTAGGVQKMVYNQRLLPARRVLLSGTGPLLISAAASLAKAGAAIVSVCEAAPLGETMRLVPVLLRRSALLKEAASYLLQLWGRGVRIRQPFAVIRASGKNRVERATIARVDRSGAAVPGTELEFAVDLIALNHLFLPADRLSRLLGCRHEFDRRKGCWHPATDLYMRTSLADVYAAGDGSGIGGADMAAIQGRIAGLHAARSLKAIDASKTDALLAPLLRERKRLKEYLDLLFEVYRLRPGLFQAIDRETVVCRCEGVSAGKVWDELDQGCRTLAELKPTRFAMGPCQGRVCEGVVCELMRQRGIDPVIQGQLRLRPPTVPVPISALERKSMETTNRKKTVSNGSR